MRGVWHQLAIGAATRLWHASATRPDLRSMVETELHFLIGDVRRMARSQPFSPRSVIIDNADECRAERAADTPGSAEPQGRPAMDRESWYMAGHSTQGQAELAAPQGLCLPPLLLHDLGQHRDDDMPGAEMT